LLPSLKLGERSFFRLANLGGRYEAGAVEIAHQHYSDAGVSGFGLLVVKINSHVSAEQDGDGYRFGRMRRYDSDSVYCGALHATMDGSDLPFARELAASFRSRGRDRLAMLADETVVAPEFRSLFVAIANSSLQAQRAVADTEARPPDQPTLFVFVHSVVLNRRQKDAEIVCGIHRIDCRTKDPARSYHGLGDDPSRYRVRSAYAPLMIEDDTLCSGPTTKRPG
jgi:hypothetical protein